MPEPRFGQKLGCKSFCFPIHPYSTDNSTCNRSVSAFDPPDRAKLGRYAQYEACPCYIRTVWLQGLVTPRRWARHVGGRFYQKALDRGLLAGPPSAGAALPCLVSSEQGSTRRSSPLCFSLMNPPPHALVALFSPLPQSFFFTHPRRSIVTSVVDQLLPFLLPHFCFRFSHHSHSLRK